MKNKEKQLERLVGSFILLTLVLAVVMTTTNHNIKRVAKASSETTIELEDLSSKYQKLNDELWEVKQSRDRLNNRIETLEKELSTLREARVVQNTVPEKPQGTIHTITCYDLSEDSNGTWKGHKWYGLTANGFDLRGHTWESARTVAVDKSIYPLGTKLKLTFVGEKYQKYNGVYTARDTGGAIKGKKLDLFLGDFDQRRTHSSVWDFGKTTAYVEVVK